MSHLPESVQNALPAHLLARIDMFREEDEEAEAEAEMEEDEFIVKDDGMTAEEIHALDMWKHKQEATVTLLDGADGRVAEEKRKQDELLLEAYDIAGEYLVLDMQDPLFEDILPNLSALKKRYAKAQKKIDDALHIKDALAEERRAKARAERERLQAEAEAAQAEIEATVAEEERRRKVAIDIIIGNANPAFPTKSTPFLQSLLFSVEPMTKPKTDVQQQFADLRAALGRMDTVVLEEKARDIISGGGAGPAGAGPAAGPFSGNTVRGRRGSRAAKRFR